MNLSGNIRVTGSTTVTHRLDPDQFAVIAHFLTVLLGVLNDADAAEMVTLTEKLKASTDGLNAAVNEAEAVVESA